MFVYVDGRYTEMQFHYKTKTSFNKRITLLIVLNYCTRYKQLYVCHVRTTTHMHTYTHRQVKT